MSKLLKKNNMIVYYRYLILERFIKLRYSNINLNLRFFFGQFYNKKLLQIIQNYNNLQNNNQKFKILFFINLFKYKIYINLTCFEQFKLILKNKFKFNNYFIINNFNQIIIATQDKFLYQSLIFELDELKKKIFEKKIILVETNKVLLQIKNSIIHFYLNFPIKFFKIEYKNNLNLVFNNLILLKFIILFLIFFVYFIIFYIHSKLYYGYIKAINKRVS